MEVITKSFRAPSGHMKHTFYGFPVELSSAVKRGTILMSSDTINDLMALIALRPDACMFNPTDTVKCHVWGPWKRHGFGCSTSPLDHRVCSFCGLSDTYVEYTGDGPCEYYRRNHENY